MDLCLARIFYFIFLSPSLVIVVWLKRAWNDKALPYFMHDNRSFSSSDAIAAHPHTYNRRRIDEKHTFSFFLFANTRMCDLVRAPIQIYSIYSVVLAIESAMTSIFLIELNIQIIRMRFNHYFIAQASAQWKLPSYRCHDCTLAEWRERKYGVVSIVLHGIPSTCAQVDRARRFYRPR